jgi:hypothetical protein
MLKSLFAAIDSMDSSTFSEHLSEGCTFRFGNLPPVVGKQEVEEFVATFFDSIQAVKHEVLEDWSIPDGLICHGRVTYTRKDSKLVSAPFSNILKFKGDKINEYLIFVDVSELYK